MKKILTSAALILTGITVGALIVSMSLWHAAPSMMLTEDPSPYDYAATVARLESTIQSEGWKTAAVHDLQMTMKKYNNQVAPVKVFEICHPDHAVKILERSDERIVSSLMPCRIAVYEKEDGKTYISRMNTKLMGQMMDGVVPEVMAVASKESEIIIKKTLE